MGRPPYPRRSDGSIVRPGEPDFEQLRAEQRRQRNADSGQYGQRGRDRARVILRDARGHFISNRGADRRSEPGPQQPSGDPATQAERVYVPEGQETGGAERIDVEPQPAKPPTAERPAPRSRTGVKGRIKPDHIAQVVVAGFAVVANASGRPWWAVQSKPAEVDPWTPAAAELANKYIPDDETAEKVLDSFAVGQIVLGLGSMITQRIAQDREVAATLARRRMEEQRERVEELRRQEGIETPTAERSNGTEPGKVSRTIPGFGEPQAGLA